MACLSIYSTLNQNYNIKGKEYSAACGEILAQKKRDVA